MFVWGQPPRRSKRSKAPQVFVRVRTNHPSQFGTKPGFSLPVTRACDPPTNTMFVGRRCLEGVSSGYWTPLAKRSSGLISH